MTDFGKIVISGALSVLAHVSLFTVLALMPENPPVPVNPTPEDKPLEVAFATASETVDAVDSLGVPASADALRTQIDPENLKKADQAPEHPVAIAAHDSQATPPNPVPAQTAPVPASPPDLSAVVEPMATPAASPQPAEEVGIDALGNYGKAVGNAIGVRSEFYRKTQKERLAVGEVRIKFTIDAQGRPSEVQVISNTASPANATIAMRAVQEAKIPPIPPERLAQVPGGRIKIVYTFTIY